MAQILLADDDFEQVSVQRKLFEALGHQVSTATSPDEVLLALQSPPPALILVDLHFPRTVDGLRLIRDIRAAGYEGPLVVLSGWPDDLYETPEEAMVTEVAVKGDIRNLMRLIKSLTE